MRTLELGASGRPNDMAALLEAVQNISWNNGGLTNAESFDPELLRNLDAASTGRLVAETACKLGWDGVTKLFPQAMLDKHVVDALLELGTVDSIHRARAILQNQITDLPMNLSPKERGALIMQLKLREVRLLVKSVLRH